VYRDFYVIIIMPRVDVLIETIKSGTMFRNEEEKIFFALSTQCNYSYFGVTHEGGRLIWGTKVYLRYRP
jgi:hypothetical protein